jgi:tRNA 2-selenouridine synthase
MISEINIADVFELNWPVIDVRSPGEYEKGHIPGTHNVPLFSNEERAHVGTVYKQQSKEAAIKAGYQYVTPKLQHFIDCAKNLAPDGKVVVHCWRGGMRSRSFAQHLSDNGFGEVKIATGGYKAYRNHVLNAFEQKAELMVLGGYTGSGKTPILYELKKAGHQVIDLEGLAHHKGSAFGGIGQAEQPTVEQFENQLYEVWRQLDLNAPIWIEDESHNIGAVKLPMPLFRQIRTSTLYFIDIPREERVKHLVEDYAACDKEKLAASIQRISKRLGGQNVNEALNLLEQNQFDQVAFITLHYYDKSYTKGMNMRNSPKLKLPLRDTNAARNAALLLQFAKSQIKAETASEVDQSQNS